MGFKPLDKMWERVEVAREDSDTSLFLYLLYLGEMLTKIVTAGLVAAIADDRDRHRYRQLHRLVRADGVGEWSQVIDDILTGTTSKHLFVSAREEQRELTQKCGAKTWQYEAVSLLDQCLKVVDSTSEDTPTKVSGRRWFSTFAVLRNKTRGHGAPPSSVCSQVCPNLEKTIRIVLENHHLFQRSWAYIHRHLNGKYSVKKLTEDGNAFNSLRSNRTTNLPDGVYLDFELEQPVRVELIETNEDVLDFFFPNGAFNGKRFELISYITGDKLDGDAALYLTPASQLPVSETQGIGILDIQGNCFGNLPPAPRGYVYRKSLESELLKVLSTERHPVITLVGRGGIGKTSLALAVLHKVAQEGKFVAMLWFSARDIDLLAEGPKLVKPQILTEKDISEEFVRLIQPKQTSENGFVPREYFEKILNKSPEDEPFIEGKPLLFVFDNFETVHRPIELFKWIDTYIRPPNKVLITTRFREFNGDYYVEVMGMNESECEELINSTAGTLGICDLLTDEYRQALYRESDGHPYVIKVLLGEVAKANKLVKVERIVASRDEILDALFERTFSVLSPTAKRVFLTLCNWQSTVPQLAVEAILLRPENEKMNVKDAIEELRRSSFVEVTESKGDEFLIVPLVAAVFGKRKLSVSPMKNAVDADMRFLQAFGTTQHSDIQRGVDLPIKRLFRHLGERVSQRPEELNNYLPMLEFIARQYPPAQLLLASLHEESGSRNSLENAKDALRRYLESAPSNQRLEAWKKLANLCEFSRDWKGEINALLEMCQLPDVSFRTISFAADRFNFFFREKYRLLDTDEKQIIVKRLADKMGERIEELVRNGDDEVTATDCSRLAWLYLHLHDAEGAGYYTGIGLDLERYNHHCLNLARKLSSSCPDLAKRLSNIFSS